MAESVLITDGVVADGTGTAPQPGGLLIEDGLITAVLPPDARLPADRVIAAGGSMITPGFIDLHSHADFTIQGSPGAVSQLHQGVTTLLTGNCGFSPFPVLDKDRLIGATSFLSADGLDWSWTDPASYAEVHDRTGLGVNLALQVGHNALRLAVLGEDQREPTRPELDRMRRLLSEAAGQGVFGFSTGLIYAPGRYADTAEVDALVAEAGANGLLYSTHVRNEGDDLLPAIEEAIGAARRGGARLEISHLKAVGPRNFGRVVDALDRIQLARQDGLDVGCDVYPYDASSTTLTARLPGWAMDGGVPALLDRLADPEQRARLVADLTSAERGSLSADRVTIASGTVFGRTLAAIAAERGISSAEATCQVLQEQHGAVSVINHGMDAQDVGTVLRHRLTAVASDGWIMAGPDDPGWQVGHPHPRNFGTFTRVLGHYTRERGLLDLAEAVRRMTSLPASRLGLTDRGVLRAGAVADVAVFDAAAIDDPADYANPWQLSTGVTDLLVAGTPVLTDGTPTGARPGRVLRRHRSHNPGVGRT
ncbi:N-acyl-D-amino-acid deacylase family protein [Microlunatus soli]|uniref:N-acyl-D-amino-acid deacylase n=1 Tax=Microlunatus soli TaxID=630515 RepID=A0A1H1MJ04_9ACTN|nr:amidohydrolase family protein [Microlunatus soli]SDR85949.1 N-acyl-D-amino-acid deacylase [Microlunatus soli]